MMERNFATVAGWLDQYDPEKKRQFNPPAQDGEISGAELRLGLTLPPSTRTLFRLANGQPSDAVSLEGSFLLMSLDAVVGAFAFLNDEFPNSINTHASDDDAPVDADPGIRAQWWSRRWVPIMQNGAGDHLCVDLDPAEGGTTGQIISYYHDEMFRSLVSRGVDGFFRDLAQRMTAGQCRIEEGMLEDA